MNVHLVIRQLSNNVTDIVDVRSSKEKALESLKSFVNVTEEEKERGWKIKGQDLRVWDSEKSTLVNIRSTSVFDPTGHVEHFYILSRKVK